MFETASIAHEVDKATWKKQEPKLRQALLAAQFRVLEKKQFPVLVLIGGVEGAGKGETVNLLHEWMDPRHINTHAFDQPSDDERARPAMWRFWQRLPPKGRIGIFFGAWHSQPIVDRAYRAISRAELDQRVAEVNRFEKMLCDEGVLLVKFWFHLTKKQQRKRLEALAADKRTRWRVGDGEWDLFGQYDRFSEASEHFVRSTSTGHAPWHIVNGADARYRSLTVGKTLLATIEDRLEDGVPASNSNAPPLLPPVDGRNVLKSLDLTQKLDDTSYEKQLEKWQGRLNLLSRDVKFRKVSVVCVFEGNDAAGKGGAIRRITQAIDARFIRPIPIAAPTEEERAQPYLWRFWRHLPRHGRIAIFDRSWYGRVLVERVEGFATEAAWMRAYQEINDFEGELLTGGSVLTKFWLAISKEEQFKRFKERERTPFKRFKITDEDWRNRKKWDEYETAVCDMIDRTSTEEAPWTLVEANDKNFARVKVLKTLCRAVEERFDSL
ncbi:MAG: polyphosphate:AMP phosphotransferase [Archangiaceae bacterium]|nr:polyphosphate:AMP phosphotransferase [Archangiaceae bacterium]